MTAVEACKILLLGGAILLGLTFDGQASTRVTAEDVPFVWMVDG